ncbi:evl-14 [Pristionchus pacificus]|uniref:Evl-14 n=1 Tax=Pristionchus pacificus TaxID=54126 RepID=A0A2A6BP72_PRIPA|nr:evl-14 [Pristionchus pacificus]|eukprot:PDM67707.1 evl-14 [Pristionchus pacificus]
MVRRAAKKAASPSSVIYPEGCEPIDPDTNNSTLVLALKGLYERLSEDETTTEDNFESLAIHLVSCDLINKPADVSVYIALCLARIFIICPSNPFDLKNEELRNALEFLAKSIGRIRCESEALYTKYHSLLEMVASSCILQQNLKQLDPDTDDGARVIATLLKSASLVVEVRKATERVQEENNEQEIERKSGVRTMIMNICRGVFEDNADHIHSVALDVIFSHLISPEKVNNPEGYHFMRKLCENGAMYIHNRISSIFVDACHTQDDPKLDSNVFKLVGKRKAAVYELLSELSEVLPDIRNDLLCLLSMKLASSEMEVRLMALKTASEVAKNRPDLPESCPSLWNRFIDRWKDSSPLVRKEIAERCKDLLYSNHDMRSTIWDFLDRLVTDQDEEVRMAAIETVCQTARKKLEAVNEKLIESCTERLRDKKVEVRKVCLKHLLAVYKDVVKREESTKSDRGSVAIIAQKVMLMYRTNPNVMTEEKVIIEKGLINSLIPMELPMKRRMEFLVEMSTKLSAAEMKILYEMLQRLVNGRTFLSRMMDCILVKSIEDGSQEKSPEEKRKITEACIEKLVRFFPHPQKAEIALRKFTNLLCVDNEGVRQMEIILKRETTVVEASSAVKQLLSRVGNAKDEINKEQEEMIRSLLSRLAPLLIDHTSLLELTRYMRDIIDGEFIGKEEASKILNRAISVYKIIGEMYPSHLNQREIIDIILTKFLENQNDFVVKCGLQCIHAMLTKEAGVNGVNIRGERWFERMKNALIVQIKEGKPNSAKHALRNFCHMLGPIESWDLIGEHLYSLLTNLEQTSDTTARSLVVLRKAVMAWKDHLLEKIMEIYPLEIARKILVPDPLTYNGGETIGVNAADYMTLEEMPVSPSMKNTLAAIKLSIRVLPLFPQGDHSTSLTHKTINVLSVCAAERGMVADDITEADAAWLTALSGGGLVRLMSDRRFSKNPLFFKPSLMNALAQVATHPLDSVRFYLMNRIYKYYRMTHLPGSFISLIPLSSMGMLRGVNVEEEERTRIRISEIFLACVQSRHNYLFGKKFDDVILRNEYFAPHFVYLLAYSPNLKDNEDEEELTKIAEVIWNCLDALSSRIKQTINWGLLCSLLNQLKTVTPKVDEDFVDRMEYSEKVWAISEIMLHLIIYKAKIEATYDKGVTLLKAFADVRKGENSKVYAPVPLLKRISAGKIQHTFHQLKISSTMLKEETKKEIKGKGRGRRKTVKKEEESDEEMEEDDDEDVKMPSTSRKGQKVMETLEEEDEDMEMDLEREIEEESVKKMRTSLKGKPPVNRRLTSMRELESIDLSPIGGGGTSRRGLAASTPIVKNGMEGGGGRGEDGQTTPKKRGRGGRPTVSPVKLPSKTPPKSPSKSPVKSQPKGSQNGTRKRSSKTIEKIEEEEEEEEEKEEEMPLPAKRGRGRGSVKKENGKEKGEPIKRNSKLMNKLSSTRGRKKKEEEVEEKEENEEEKEEEMEEEQQPPPKRGGRVPSVKKSVVPPVRKTSSRKKK